MRKTCVRSTMLGLAAALCALAARTVSAQTIVNGGFEANGGVGFSAFNNWTALDQIGSAGSFYVQSGTGTPLFGQLTPPPPEGSFAAMTDAGGSGSHILYQDFTAPNVFTSASLSFQLFINNQAADFSAPNTLDFSAVPNQQARVDLLLASADPFSVAPGDVLLNLYQTQPGDPLTSGYSLVNKDITGVLAAHGGAALRLRFSEVDNQFFFNLGVDDVRLSVVPEPSSSALLAGVLIVGAGILARRRRWRRSSN